MPTLRSAVALAALLAFAGEAAATPTMPCAKRSELLERLSGKYSEEPRGIGLGADGQAFELLVSPASGSWTMLRTAPSGVSCIVAVGVHWTFAIVAAGDPA